MHATDLLTSGREAFTRARWEDAFGSLSAVPEEQLETARDLQELAVAAWLTGNTGDAMDAWMRAHHRYLEEGAVGPAVRCAFWIGMTLLLAGEQAPGSAWLGRGARLLDSAGLDAVERGYLLLPAALGTLRGGEPGAAHSRFEQVVATAERFEDAELRALGRLGCGESLVAMGRAADGVAMLDEAMVAVTAGDVSPIPAGIIYCAVITVCRAVFDVRRAAEWTEALSRWCARQQGLRPYRGQCLVHRSELLQLRGDWSQAMQEIEEACAHLSADPDDPVMGMARYQQAELLRLRGDFEAAEVAYRRASERGHRVQPGLALLRLAQGRLDDAEAAIRRVAEEAGHDHGRRSRVLAAFVEIALAVGDLRGARAAAEELDGIAADVGTPYLAAVAAAARGSVALAGGEAAAAHRALSEAWSTWRDLEAPYEAACVRLRMAEACRLLGDHDTAEMERNAACRALDELGAGPGAARSVLGPRPSSGGRPGGLTAREVEVLRLVATGATNRAIADELVISEKTVARHVSNIFTKLDVGSRAAATAWAYEHEVV